MKKKEIQQQVGFKAPPSKYDAWKADAAAAGDSFNQHVIRCLDAVHERRVGPEFDPELDAALARLEQKFPVGNRAALIRACVILVDRANAEAPTPLQIAPKVPKGVTPKSAR